MIDTLPFTNPFRYVPHPLVREAAEAVIREIDSSEDMARLFAEGKMMGVLIAQDEDGNLVTLKGFSGAIGGQGCMDGFVPPIFDLTQPGGYYRSQEQEITRLNRSLEGLLVLKARPLEAAIRKALQDRESELDRLREEKKKASSIRESQFANGEIKRAKDRWKEVICGMEKKMKEVQDRISFLKKTRAEMSDSLQKWIFDQYIVHNAKGEKASITEIFRERGLTPPGGTGDCAAPKLLNHAYMNGLRPLAMGEFWYGKSPATAVRTHGHFYPSCTSKCGPLLAYMLKGLMSTGGWDVKTESLPTESETGIVYEDDCIMAVSKPSGMPSVPGLDGRESLQEWIQNRMGIKVFPVHRLDMDTSGIIVFAKTAEAEVNLKKQFEEHTVRKTYKARLSPVDTHRFAGNTPVLKPGDKGTVKLPLSPDYDERPRQKVDKSQGKPSLTEYEVLSVNEDGTTDILFHPHTGRTHQLRVHSAHIMGLGRPILGDLLYGGCSGASEKGLRAANLCLHALRITFRHPSSDEEITLQV